MYTNCTQTHTNMSLLNSLNFQFHIMYKKIKEKERKRHISHNPAKFNITLTKTGFLRLLKSFVVAAFCCGTAEHKVYNGTKKKRTFYFAFLVYVILLNIHLHYIFFMLFFSFFSYSISYTQSKFCYFG